MEQMYKGIPFSPTATLTANISVTDTIIPVSNVDAFPDAPNIATIGSIAGPNETIIYTGKTTTTLTGCTRGVEGTASDWAVDELIGRNFTAKDHADMVKNIEELESNKLDASYKVDVVNTADVTVGGKALDAKQNNPNITGTLAQKVANNTQQINDLNKYENIQVVFLNGFASIWGMSRQVRLGNEVEVTLDIDPSNATDKTGTIMICKYKPITAQWIRTIGAGYNKEVFLILSMTGEVKIYGWSPDTTFAGGQQVISFKYSTLDNFS